MVSGLLSRHRPMVLSRVWHRACLCCVPLPQLTEHCGTEDTSRKTEPVTFLLLRLDCIALVPWMHDKNWIPDFQ